MNIGRLEPEQDRSAAIIMIVTGAIHLALALALLVIMNLPASAQDAECSLPVSDTKWVRSQIGTTILVLNQAKICAVTDCLSDEAKAGRERLLKNIDTRIDLLKRVAACMKEAGE